MRCAAISLRDVLCCDWVSFCCFESDVQADPRTGDGLIERYIDLVNGLDADLVLFSGDLVTRGMDHIERGAAALSRIQARYGTFACLGDHDIWSNPERIQQRLSEEFTKGMFSSWTRVRLRLLDVQARDLRKSTVVADGSAGGHDEERGIGFFSGGVRIA